jgi:hypothetical protein
MGDVIYLEDDADQSSDEPKPKADAMTINGADAMALHEFVRHVNIRCYDERFKDNRRAFRPKPRTAVFKGSEPSVPLLKKAIRLNFHRYRPLVLPRWNYQFGAGSGPAGFSRRNGELVFHPPPTSLMFTAQKSAVRRPPLTHDLRKA